MISRNQMIFLLLFTSLLLLLYMLLHNPLSICSPCPPFESLTSLLQLKELTKRSQCGHVKTLNTLYR